jgi:hypothetical protein
MVLYKHPDDGKVPKDNFTHSVTPSSEIVDYDYVTSRQLSFIQGLFSMQ